MRIVLVSPSYKRPMTAFRLLHTLAYHKLHIAPAVIWILPPNCAIAVWRDPGCPVDWQPHAQRQAAISRTHAVLHAIDRHQPDLIWLTDDDVIATQYTRITASMLTLLRQPTTGLVGITRQ